MCAYACARESGIIGIFTIQFSILNLSFHEGAFSSNIFFQNDPLFFSKRPVTFPKTTCCFSQNDLLFFQKRLVTFLKTTRHFSQNDLSLFSKRPVTFPKTTRHFSQNDPSFYPYLCFNLYKTKLSRYVSFLLLRFSLDGTHNGGTANISFVAPPFGEN